MTRRRTAQDETTDVILSAAKNLVDIRGTAPMPRSFAALRMTTISALAEKVGGLQGGEALLRLFRTRPQLADITHP